ncbi:hypothetical protein [Haloplanus pelagicus]|jgi:hypothetical protein|uniref:hypothetical protein n=1 Tax=Haloplanus pelagicus TaxID=2949995 RepID=UPI00204005FE|nr:hypothetical protein [Haloplanus sp. HW8-1]
MSVRTTPSDSTAVTTAPTRYDLLLVLLPLPLLLGAFASVLTSVPLELGVGAGSLLSAMVFGYAITVAAPTRPDLTGRSA